jgi:hypothetical protein
LIAIHVVFLFILTIVLFLFILTIVLLFLFTLFLHLQFNFSGYDGLFWSLANRSMGLIAILGCQNPLYDGGEPVTSKQGQQAYARFAAAMAAHYAGGRVLYELVNEPNLQVSVQQHARDSSDHGSPPLLLLRSTGVQGGTSSLR